MIEKSTSEFGQTLTTAKKPDQYKTRLLSIRDENGKFVATIAQCYTGMITLCSGKGLQLVEDEN